MNTGVRKAYVAGKFYPGSKPEIMDLLEKIREHEEERITFNPEGKRIIGGIIPHAGHVYSGYQAVHFFEALRKASQDFDLFVILHPIHRGGSSDYATDTNRYWNTPLGIMELDREFIEAMEIPESEDIHKWEHSAEVILPIIQFYNFGEKKIVPVGICWQHPDSSREISSKICKAVETTGKKICILASSDFSHFVSPEEGKKLDQKAIDQILYLQPEDLYRTVIKNNLSICGYGPIMALLNYAQSTGSQPRAEILARGHSGEIYPSDSVVDYVTIAVYN